MDVGGVVDDRGVVEFGEVVVVPGVVGKVPGWPVGFVVVPFPFWVPGAAVGGTVVSGTVPGVVGVVVPGVVGVVVPGTVPGVDGIVDGEFGFTGVPGEVGFIGVPGIDWVPGVEGVVVPGEVGVVWVCGVVWAELRPAKPQITSVAAN